MGTQNSVAQWALANDKKLALNVKELTWIHDWLPGAHDIKVSIEISQRKFVGRGTSNARDLSFTKAVAESVERAVAFENGLSDSNGVAAQEDLELAKVGAAREMIERDRYFNHHYHQIPMIPIKSSAYELQGAQPLLKKLASLGIFCEFSELEPFNQFLVILARLSGHDCIKPFGSFIGLGCSHSRVKALSHATYEATRKVAHRVLNDDKNEIDLESFQQTACPKISDHGLLARNLEYSKLLTYKKVLGKPRRILPEVKLNTFKFYQLKTRQPELVECPLVVVSAENNSLTQLIIGSSNLDTLRGEHYSSSLNALPHGMS